MKVWDAATGQEMLTLNGHTKIRLRVAFSPDGRRIASASGDKSLKVWDAGAGRELLTLRGHTAIVQGVAYSPDGRRIASTGYDGTVKLWDAVTGQEARTLAETLFSIRVWRTAPTADTSPPRAEVRRCRCGTRRLDRKF